MFDVVASCDEVTDLQKTLKTLELEIGLSVLGHCRNMTDLMDENLSVV